MNYSLSISILYLLQKDYMAQPLQTASSATDEQLISSTVTQEIRLHRRREREREREKSLRNWGTKTKKIKITIHHCHTHGHGWNVGHGCRHVGCVSLAECSSLLFLGVHSEVAKTNYKQCGQNSARKWTWWNGHLHTPSTWSLWCGHICLTATDCSAVMPHSLYQHLHCTYTLLNLFLLQPQYTPKIADSTMNK